MILPVIIAQVDPNFLTLHRSPISPALCSAHARQQPQQDLSSAQLPDLRSFVHSFFPRLCTGAVISLIILLGTERPASLIIITCLALHPTMTPFTRGVHPAYDLATAVMLSSAAGTCSALGAVIAVFLAGVQMPLHRLACSQAALGAALLFLGCCDLLPEAAAGISILRTLIFFAFGALGSAVAAKLLRLRGTTSFVTDSHHRRQPSSSTRNPGDAQPPYPSPPPLDAPQVIPPALAVPVTAAAHSPDVLVVGMITFVSLSVHNLLEGMSILFAVREGLESEVRLAAAISLENIPEGVCIALPLYFAMRRKSIAIRMALFSGMMEPLGVLLSGLFLSDFMTQTYISSTLAIIAGILVFVALAEMLPLAVKTASTRTMASLSVWMGCGVLSATLFQPLLMYHARVGRIE